MILPQDTLERLQTTQIVVPFLAYAWESEPETKPRMASISSAFHPFDYLPLICMVCQVVSHGQDLYFRSICHRPKRPHFDWQLVDWCGFRFCSRKRRNNLEGINRNFSCTGRIFLQEADFQIGVFNLTLVDTGSHLKFSVDRSCFDMQKVDDTIRQNIVFRWFVSSCSLSIGFTTRTNCCHPLSRNEVGHHITLSDCTFGLRFNVRSKIIGESMKTLALLRKIAALFGITNMVYLRADYFIQLEHHASSPIHPCQNFKHRHSLLIYIQFSSFTLQFFNAIPSLAL